MCDLSLSYLFQIYTATPLVFIYTYIQSIHFCFDQIPRMVKLGSATRSLNTAALEKALATNSNTAKDPQTELSAKTTERQNKNGRPHSRHWGFCPLSPPGQVFW